MYSQNKIQLFLLHFAGGSCYSFDFLNTTLSKRFECHALELPGRGKRNQEKLLLHKEEAIQDYCDQIRSLRNNQPYVIYGHSMGATLGLSVVKKLEYYFDAPKILIVSGNAGPGASYKDIQRYDLNDLEFKEELRTLGGVPEEVLQNQELFEFFSPIMRADFRILEKNKNSEIGLVINTPIYAIMGDEEETVNEIDNWKNYTNGNFKSKVLKGNHFFIHTQKKEVSAILNGFDQNSFQKQL